MSALSRATLALQPLPPLCIFDVPQVGRPARSPPTGCCMHPLLPSHLTHCCSKWRPAPLQVSASADWGLVVCRWRIMARNRSLQGCECTWSLDYFRLNDGSYSPIVHPARVSHCYSTLLFIQGTLLRFGKTTVNVNRR